MHCNLFDLYSIETILTFMHYAHPFDRENINRPEGKGMTVLFTIASLAVGFVLGVEWYDHAVLVRVLQCSRKSFLVNSLGLAGPLYPGM
jgi:hypothetical protein